MATTVSSSTQEREYCIIRVSHEPNAKEVVECELEMALEHAYPIIVVEPQDLGNETVRWIQVGNFLHKSAVICSIGALISTPFLPRSVSKFTAIPLGVFALLCAGLYDLSWQFDPCCKYQVDYHGTELPTIPTHELHCPSPVVLVQRNDKYRKILHNSFALAVVAFFGWQGYLRFKA
ncbi:hypothetical protein EMCRGX_G027511 [Ephydatia muelleri]